MKNLTIIYKEGVFSSITNLKTILSAGAYLIRGDYALDATHTLNPEENALLIVSTRKGPDENHPNKKIRHSLVICSQGAFFDDVKVWSEDQITARRPIILTPETTEVDEETYQKLLSDDVDVIFKTGDNYCILTYTEENDAEKVFYYTGFSREGESLSETYFYGYEVKITKTGNPHQCEVIDNSIESQFSQILLNEGFIRGYDLSPVLQEIDLTGTDAERKAKLDKFEANWKELTGASDLKGARFVGNTLVDGNEITGVLTYNVPNGAYSGICRSEKGENFIIEVSIDALIITPLFFHLEPVPLTTTTSTNKTQLDLFLSKVPNAQIMHCTYKDAYAGTLHKINGSWYGVLVGESNTLAGQLSIKLQADGTIVEGTA